MAYGEDHRFGVDAPQSGLGCGVREGIPQVQANQVVVTIGGDVGKGLGVELVGSADPQ